jgi:hypothetical protein
LKLPVIRSHIRLLCFFLGTIAFAKPVSGQANTSQKKLKQASSKVEKGIEKDNTDTLAQGYFDLGESYYQKGELLKSETYYQKSKDLYQKMDDAEGVAKSSRALAIVQEDLNKISQAFINYNTAKENSFRSKNFIANSLNENDISRLSDQRNAVASTDYALENVKLGMINRDTGEIISGYTRMGNLNLSRKNTGGAIAAFKSAYNFSIGNPLQAQRFNQQVTDLYLKDKNFSKAIETKKTFLGESIVENSTELKAREINSLADIYIKKKEDSTAILLLRESYDLSVANGHTFAARASVEKLDSIYQANGQGNLSLPLYKDFLIRLPAIIAKDSSLIDERIVAETELKIKQLEGEKAVKDELIRRKNLFNYWLLGSFILLAIFTVLVLTMLRRLRTRNRKIALQ